MFGGLANGAPLTDTWTWDGAAWTQVGGASPPPRADHAAAYDPIREEVIVFGGWDGVAQGDTWAWTGTWVKRSDTGPTPRFASGIAWDYARRRLVLVGGANTGGVEFADVWE